MGPDHLRGRKRAALRIRVGLHHTVPSFRTGQTWDDRIHD
jgi:hypothetical protein